MFTAIKLFFSTGLGKGLLVVSAVILAVVATYSLGSAHGYSKGHGTGFNEGRQSRQLEVNHLQKNVAALTKLVNDERLATSVKVQSIQESASIEALVAQTKLQANIQQRDAIIAEYTSRVPEIVQKSCGLDLETVKAINKLIDNINEDRHEDNESTSPSTDRDPSHSGDDRLRNPDEGTTASTS